jgi:hypothetical protein
MAIDVQFVIHLPMAAEAEVPQSLYKVLSLPKAPTISEEVWIAGDIYFFVNRVRYREDGRIEEHFDGQSLGGWSAQGTQDAYATLAANDWLDSSPWIAEPAEEPAP